MGQYLREQMVKDPVEMEGSAVDMGKIGIGGAEDEREVGAGEDDSVEGFAPHESLGKGGEVAVLLAICRRLSGARKFNVGVVNEVDLGWRRSDDFYVMEFAEERGLDHKAGTEDRDAASRPRVEFTDKRVKDVDDGHGRDSGELADAIVRSDRWDGSELGSGGMEAADKAGEIFGETGKIVGLDVGEDARSLRVGDDDVESATVRVGVVGFR
jgi:hypothetical protein